MTYRAPMDGFPEGFEIRRNASVTELQQHVDYARALNLPEADLGPVRRLSIVAGGPSADLYDVEGEGESVALNSAIKLFTALGRAPTYWFAIDPQPHLADFVRDGPAETTYFVASRCHPEVFRALEGKRAFLWHAIEPDVETPASAVPAGFAVTLSALKFFRLMGYRRFDIYGWDGCYLAGRKYAIDSPSDGRPPGSIRVNLARQGVGGASIPGKTFLTSYQWTTEAQEAVVQLRGADYDFTIHGPGMIAEMARLHVTDPAAREKS